MRTGELESLKEKLSNGVIIWNSKILTFWLVFHGGYRTWEVEGGSKKEIDRNSN